MGFGHMWRGRRGLRTTSTATNAPGSSREVDLVDDGHVDRIAGMRLRIRTASSARRSPGQYASAVVARENLAGRPLQSRWRGIDGNDCRDHLYRATRALQRKMTDRSEPVPGGVNASGLRGLRKGERGADAGGMGAVPERGRQGQGQHELVRRPPRRDLDLCNSEDAPQGIPGEPFTAPRRRPRLHV